MVKRRVVTAERPDVGYPAVAHLGHPVRVANLASADRYQVEVAALEAPDQLVDSASASRPRLLAGQGGHDVDVEADAAHGDHGGVGERLDPAREPEIRAIPLRGPEPPGRHVEDVGPGRSQDGDELPELAGTLDNLGVVVRFLPLRDPHGDHEFGSDGLAHRRGDLRGKPRAVGYGRSAVLVRPQVGSRPQELVEQEAVAGVQLDAISANFLRVDRALDKRVPDAVQLGYRRGAAEGLARMREPGRA